MKTGRPRPALSLKNALTKSSSSRSMEAKVESPCGATYLVEILPQLFIADYNTVKCAELLEEQNISVVVNLISHKCVNMHADRFSYESYELADTSSENLLKVVEDVVVRIDGHLKEGRRVVVHCMKGVSRAPATIIAYLMLVNLMSFEAAFDLVRSKSPRVDPNAGFLMQLNHLI